MLDLDGTELPSELVDLSVVADVCLDSGAALSPEMDLTEFGFIVASLIAGSSLMRASSRLLVTSCSSLDKSDRILLYLAELLSSGEDGDRGLFVL